MAINYKRILAYGLTQEEIQKIKNRRITVIEISNEIAKMKLEDIICGKVKEGSYDELPEDEKAVIFNGFSERELKENIKFIRGFVTGGVLAVVTEQSKKWTFKYLIEHLVEEREWYKEQQRGKE